jgi:hypothetical protein
MTLDGNLDEVSVDVFLYIQKVFLICALFSLSFLFCFRSSFFHVLNSFGDPTPLMSSPSV